MIHNQAHITNMRLEIPDANTTANFVTSAQSVVLPTMEMDITRVSINQMTSGIMPGSKIIYEPFRIRFLIDENFESYKELYQWMISVTDSRTFNSTAHLPGARPRSILVHILDNSKKNIVLTFKFHDPFPSSLDDIELSYVDDGNPALIGNVTFSYSSMSVVGVNDLEILPKQNPVGIGAGHPFQK
ncbi:putative tail completion and sheath stabilizer protein [Aeromonas phage P19]|nr:putative tail completion and sheath stabilizer protein [Aeromonas phage P19]